MTIPTLYELSEMLRIYLWYVMLAGWRALPVLAIAIIVSICLRRHLAAKYHAMLWSLVVLRMLMPISVVNPLSIQGPIDQAALRLLEDEPEKIDIPVLPQPFVFTGKSISSSGVSVQESGNTNQVVQANAIEQSIASKEAESIDWEQFFCEMLVWIFAIGAFLFLLRNVVAYVRFARMLDRCPIIEEASLILLVNRECRNLGIARVPLLREVRELSSPAVFGLFRSTICLPVGLTQSLSANELRWVVRHELAHIGRYDSWMMMLAVIARSLHWFNPLAWLATAKLRSYVETAADQVAISSSDEADAASYGHLLVRIAEQSRPNSKSVALGLLPFTSVASLKRRLVWLSSAHRSKREWTNWFAMLAVLGCVGFVLTDATASVDEEIEHSAPRSKPYKRPTQFSVEIVSPKASTTDIVSKHEIDLTSILPKVKEVWTTSQDPASEVVSLCKGFNPSVDFQLDGNMLSIESTATQAQSIRQMLDAWTSSGPRQISVELRVLQLELRYASAIDWITQRIDHAEQDGAMVAAKITFNELIALSRVASSAKRSELTFAPKVTLFNGQCVSVSDVYEQPYVTAVHFKRNENDKTASMEPVIVGREIGLKALLTPVMTAENNIRMTFDLHRNRVDRVAIADLPYTQYSKSEASDAQESTISTGCIVQVPSFSTSSIKSTVELSPFETILIASPEPYPEENPAGFVMTTLYAITPRILDIQ